VIRTRARRLGALSLASWAVLLGACHASTTVAICVRADGTGSVTVSVTLDRSARVALAGATTSTSSSSTALPAVPLGDLRAHGWTVGSWRATAAGGAAITLSKGFTGAAGLSSVLAELDGRNGALRDSQLVRSRSLLRDRDSVSVVADLRELSVGVKGDAGLAARLRAAGVDVDALDRQLQAQLGSALDLTLELTLPDGTVKSVAVKPGTTQTVSVASAGTHYGRLLALVVAAGAAFLGLLMLLAAALNARRARRL
jgi:hypothetical protein